MTKKPVIPWAVLKFGGTSVSSADNWAMIVRIVRRRQTEGLRPVVVHSALNGVSNQLEALGQAALRDEHAVLIDAVEAQHRALAADLGIAFPAQAESLLAELRQLATGTALVAEISPRMQARVMATGELLATRLGAAFLQQQGIEAEWLDVRDILHSETPLHANEYNRYLSATCRFEPDADMQQRLAAAGELVVTQGFIARDAKGHTVLLGRGGSDTSAAYLAARLQAQRLEIWTDVPGMFTADPRLIPEARLLRALDYDEAQEIVTTGAKVLHPRCIAPARASRIPLSIHYTPDPELEGTVIASGLAAGAAQVKAISKRSGITLVSMETMGMWQQVGFLADAFACFKQQGLSIDLVSTSETNVTVSLDPSANSLDPDVLERLTADLAPLCRARIIGPCAAISLVGRHIRAILHRLGPVLEAFEEQHIHLVTQASNDLNLTFVVDERQANRLVQRLHALLISKHGNEAVLGPTWAQLFAHEPVAVPHVPWWRRKSAALLELAAQRSPAYVYDTETVDEAARQLLNMRAVDRVLYAVKANNYPGILRRLHIAGLGFECVSPGEIAHIRKLFPGIEPQRLLFTPNFAGREEYAAAFAQNVPVTLDNLHPLHHWPELFAGREIFVRIDPGRGHGHHQHVRTGGVHSKFGVPLFELDELAKLAAHAGARITGLHAHLGSGILNHDKWQDTAVQLAQAAERFPDVQVLDLGGGLGIAEKPGDVPLDVARLDAALQAFKQAYPRYRLWIEPGRFLVARAGVLLARVTQTKGKGEVRYVGVNTGMNSLLRPALYGAYHDIVNLTRLDEAASETVNVVGPICETGDVLGMDRLLPPCAEGDILLIANTGAYGYAMSSNYNLRPPAEQCMLE